MYIINQFEVVYRPENGIMSSIVYSKHEYSLQLLSSIVKYIIYTDYDNSTCIIIMTIL